MRSAADVPGNHAAARAPGLGVKCAGSVSPVVPDKRALASAIHNHSWIVGRTLELQREPQPKPVVMGPRLREDDKACGAITAPPYGFRNPFSVSCMWATSMPYWLAALVALSRSSANCA